jgi:hypothetical protein
MNERSGSVDFRGSTSRVPESNDVHPAGAVITAVNDTIGTNYNFADLASLKLRHYTPHLRKFRQAFRVGYEKLPEFDSSLR